jgi:hypothetical protein
MDESKPINNVLTSRPIFFEIKLFQKLMVIKLINVFLNFDIQSPKKMITTNYVLVVLSYPWLLIVKSDEQFVY